MPLKELACLEGQILSSQSEQFKKTFQAGTIQKLLCFWTYIACLHNQTKVTFLEGRLFSSQSELFENFSDCSDWLDKSRSSKKPLF